MMKLAITVCLAFLLLWSASGIARHGSGFLDPNRPTPGVRIELIELPTDPTAGPKKYRLRAEGLPRGLTYEIWTKSFGQPFAEVHAGFRMNDAGDVLLADAAGRSRRLEDVALEPGPYPRGAVWMVALASDDHKLSAFAKVIPYPITVRDGGCSVSLELISLHGNRFLATGAGFPPASELDVESRIASRSTHRRLRATADGRLPPDVLSHGGVDTDLNASYAIKSASCSPVIQYQWGEAALKRR